MESPKHTLMRSVMTYGAFLGIIIVFYNLSLFLFGFIPVGYLQVFLSMLTFVTYVVGIYISTKKIRKIVFNEHFSYGQSLVTGTLIAMFAAAISEFYVYLQNTILDPGYVSRWSVAQRIWWTSYPDKTLGTNMINTINERLQNYDALNEYISFIFLFTVLGFTISLITSAFLKSKSDPIQLKKRSDFQN